MKKKHQITTFDAKMEILLSNKNRGYVEYISNNGITAITHVTIVEVVGLNEFLIKHYQYQVFHKNQTP